MISLMMVEDEKGAVAVFKNLLQLHDGDFNFLGEIGRASCRERV